MNSEESPNTQFLQSGKLMLSLMAVFAGVTAIFYLGVFFATGFWQAMVGAVLMILAAATVPLAYWGYKNSKVTLTTVVIMLDVILGYGSNELIWDGLLFYHIVGGTLLILMIQNLLLPRRYGLWMITVAVYNTYVLLVNQFEPIERVGSSQLPILLPYAIGANILMVAALIGVTLYVSLRRTIRIRLRIYFALLALVPLVISGTVSSYLAAQSARDGAVSHLESAVAINQAQLISWLDTVVTNLSQAIPAYETSQIVYTLSNQGPNPSLTIFRTQVGANFRRILNDSQKNGAGEYESIFLMNTKGTVIFSTDPALMWSSKEQEDYFKVGLTQVILSTPYISPATEKATTIVALPILDESQATVGVVAAQLNFNQISAILQSYTGLGSSGEVFLLGADRLLLTPTRYGLSIGSTYPALEPATDPIGPALAQKGDGQVNYVSYQNVPVLAAYHYIPNLQVLIMAQQDVSEALLTTIQTTLINVGVIIFSLILAFVVAWYASNRITIPIGRLTTIARANASGNLTMRAEIEQDDEIGALAEVFNQMTDQLRQQMNSLEERVSARTDDLERRSTQIQVAAEIARDASSSREMDVLLNRAVELVRERFKFYHAGIFLTDARGEYAVLQAATGEAGRIMLENGHRLKLGSEGMVGDVAARGHARIALDVGEDAAHFKNPLLPETRSEMTLPLKVGENIIGVLDVQSVEETAFTQEDVIILQTMADQLAVAIENARLFRESQESLRQVETLYSDYSQQSWQQIIEATNLQGYQFDIEGLQPLNRRGYDLFEPDDNFDQVDKTALDAAAIAIPLRVRGQKIGVLKVWPNPDKPLEDHRLLLNALGERISQALESARLYQESQVRAASEELVGSITSHMRATLDIDTVLQTAVREIRQALNLEEVSVQLGFEETSDHLPTR